MKDALQPEIVEVCAASWPIVPLREVCRIELGKTPARGTKSNWDEDKSTGNVWLSIADMPTSLHAEATESREHVSETAAREMRLVPEGTLLVSFKLTLGRLCYAGRDLFTNEAIAAILDLDETRVLKPFLYWYLTYFDWDAAAAGDHKIKGKTLNKAKLKALPIPLPPLEEQKRIVAVLDQAFAALDRARAHAEANLADARGLFDSWLMAAFASGAAHWPKKTLPEISENLDRFRVPITKSDRNPGDVPYYGASGVVDHVAQHIFDEDLLLVSEDGANLLARTYPIAFSISGKAWVNNHAHVLRFESLDSQEFVRLFLNSISLTPWVSGMAQPKLNQKALSSIPIPYPDATDRKRIVAEAAAVWTDAEAARENYGAQLQDIFALRQSLLQQAFSGRLT